MWGWIAWSVVALAVWVAVAGLVGVLLGRVVRRRDCQVPGTVEVTVGRASADDAVPEPRQHS